MSAPAGTLVGDGTTARSRARSRWRAARWPLLVLVTVLLVVLVAALARPRTSSVPASPDNPSATGARAVAEILREQGVEIEFVRTSGAAVSQAGPGSTLLVVGTYLLSSDQVRALAGTEADLVVLEPEYLDVDTFTDGRVSIGGAGPATAPVPARCLAPAAVAAGAVQSSGSGLRAESPDVDLCFSGDDGTSGSYAVVEVAGRQVTLVDDRGLMLNEQLDQDGNAALMLGTLGRHDRLVWYVPSFGDTGDRPEPGGSLLPGWAGPLGAQLLLVVLVVALWRGRALGPVVTEPLPVTVRAAETTLGRGRLYRRSHSRGHAGAALRAGTARRAAARLGVPRTAGATDVIDALARATGRSTEQVADLLYGPPPTDDAGLLRLARLLDELESEVHRT